jgi:hypothetical protein
MLEIGTVEQWGGHADGVLVRYDVIVTDKATGKLIRRMAGETPSALIVIGEAADQSNGFACGTGRQDYVRLLGHGLAVTAGSAVPGLDQRDRGSVIGVIGGFAAAAVNAALAIYLRLRAGAHE